MKTVIVTGGAGFIGSHLVDGLLQEGCRVIVIDDFSTGKDKNLQQSVEKFGDNLTVVKADVVSSEAYRAVVESKPVAIFHQAAQMNVRRSVAEPMFDAEKNVLGTVNMLEAARVAGTKRFFFASTGGAIYGEQEEFPASENHPSRPECPYGVSKNCGENYLEYYSRSAGMQCTALRYANVYGPRQSPKGEAGVVAIFSERILRNESLQVNGDGLQTRDYVFVRDVVSANLGLFAQSFLSASTQGSTSAFEPGFFTYNVGTGVESTVLDLVNCLKVAYPEIAKEKGFRAEEIVYHHSTALPGEQRRSVINNAKLSKQIGWSPTVKLQQGLYETLKSFS